MEPAVGVEPTTDGLQNRCSTTELSRPGVGDCNAGKVRLKLKYGRFQRNFVFMGREAAEHLHLGWESLALWAGFRQFEG